MKRRLRVSVVMTVYNEGDWPNRSLGALDEAVGRSNALEAEAVIIDDGSTDQTADVVRSFKPKSKRLKIKFIQSEKNLGRYLGRKAGVEAASHDYIMFLDGRVLVDKDSLAYLEKKLEKNAEQVWNSHVNVAKKGNIFARFWDALVCIAWRRYFGNPRETSYSLKDFDHFPKGTTCFYVSKKLFMEAMDSVDKKAVSDRKYSNDDTSLIRYIAGKQRINISPKFSCVYNARATLKGFLKHAYHRGQVFTDGFLQPGNRFFLPLIGFMAATVAAAGALVFAPLVTLVLLVATLGLMALAAVLVGTVCKLDARDTWSLALLSPAFAVVYGSGIWRGFFRKYRIDHWFTKKRNFLGGNIREYTIITVSFAVLTFLFTDGTVLDIGHRLFVSGVGDGIAGFLWLAFADQDWNPLLGHTDWVNYPIGTDLSNPQFITYTFLWTPFWLLSRLFGNVTALNLVTFWGFIGGALLMYLLVKRITMNPRIAFFAGFAAAFVPYHIFNSSSHLSYIYSMVFVAILGAFIAFWRRPTVPRAALLAAAIAWAFYTDGYFLLLASGFVGVLFFAGLVYNLLNKYSVRDFLKLIRYSLVMVGLLLLMLSPIIYVQLSAGSEVKGALAASRGDIRSELAYYAAQPVDYLLPPITHPAFEDSKLFLELHAHKNQRSNPVESTLYIGYVVIIFCLVGVVMLASYIFLGRGPLARLGSRDRQIFMFIACLSIVGAPILVLMSAPPSVSVFGWFTVPTLADVLLRLDLALWRVMARFFLVIHTLLVVFAAASLWAYVKGSPKLSKLNVKWQYIGLAVLLLMVTFEYAVKVNRPGFDFNHLPPGYTWLKERDDIQVVAEFPLIDRPLVTGYRAIAGQLVHGKKLVNSHLADTAKGSRNPFGVATNPEAIDFVIARGAQAIILHQDKPCTEQYAWGALSYSGTGWNEPFFGDVNTPYMCIYTNLKPLTHDELFVKFGAGFVEDIMIRDGALYNLLYGNYADMQVVDEMDELVTKPEGATLHFQLVSTPTRPDFVGVWRVLQQDKLIASGTVENRNPQTIEVVVDPSLPIQLRINDIQGKDPQVGQLSLQYVTVTAQ